jgi:hypothetical protein
VLGPSVNLAARLESLNKVYGTAALVSGQIKRRAEARFLFRSVDRIAPRDFPGNFRYSNCAADVKQPIKANAPFVRPGRKSTARLPRQTLRHLFSGFAGSWQPIRTTVLPGTMPKTCAATPANEAKQMGTP